MATGGPGGAQVALETDRRRLSGTSIRAAPPGPEPQTPISRPASIPDAPPVAGRHVPALDGIRGLAVAGVMLAHAAAGAPYLQGGAVGVDAFFVLSGFLITSILVREYDDSAGRISMRRFYARRVLRLGPALIALLLTILAGSWLLLDPAGARDNTIDVLITLFYATNWARAFQLHPPNLLGHTWSLSIEEQFYILWPMVLLLLLRGVRSRLHVVYLLGAAALGSWGLRAWMAWHGATVWRMYDGLDTRADSLLVGCTLGVFLASGLLREEDRPGLAVWLRRLAPVSAAVFVWITWSVSWKSPSLYYWLMAVVELLVALTILQIYASERSPTASLLSLRPLVWTGSISYGLYLWHFPIYAVLRATGRGPRAMVAGTILTFVIAAASYYALERPILRFKQRLGGGGIGKFAYRATERA